MIRERMAEISQAVLNERDGVKQQIESYNGDMAERLGETIGSRSARMLEALAGTDPDHGSDYLFAYLVKVGPWR